MKSKVREEFHRRKENEEIPRPREVDEIEFVVEFKMHKVTPRKNEKKVSSLRVEERAEKFKKGKM